MKKTLLTVFVFALAFMQGLAQTPASINMQSATITTCLTQLYDDGGPASDYGSNRSDTLVIYPANPNGKVSITFHNFNTQEAVDFLYVHNGNSITAPLITTLSGAANYGTVASTAADGSLTLLFQSNAQTVSDGWFATITNDTVPEDITMIGSRTWTVSSGRFMDNGGPNLDYGNNAFSTVTLTPPNPGDKISVTFHYCEIDPGDFLYVFNGSILGVNQIATVTGTNFGTITSTAPDGSLTFQFQSNAAGTGRGWMASITVNTMPDDITPIADGIYTVSKGRFYDNGGIFSDYTDSKQATVTMLPASAGSKVSVTFHETEFASGDFLYVYNGTSTSAPLLAAITGTNVGTVKSTDASGALTFKFVSNNGGTGFGWDASISTMQQFEDVTMMARGNYNVGCLTRFYDNGGPGADYGDNQNIVTTLNPIGLVDKLTVTFHSFFTSTQDTLYIYNGSDTSAALLGSYCGNLASFAVTSTAVNGSLTFKFVTNASGNQYGWNATVACNASLPAYNIPLNSTATITTDRAYFYDSGGPGNDYDVNEISQITFSPVNPATEKMSVSFTSFITYNENDYLAVYDGPSAFSPLITKIYAYAGYGTITASAANTSGSLTFKFVSDGGANTAGWAATVGTDIFPANISLPGTYTVNSGFYYDRGGPGINYTDFVDDVTTIKPVTAGDKISLNFSYFQTYNINDYIEVHDGTSVTDPLLAKLYSAGGYGTITATNATGALTLRFVSDGGANWNGWAAEISTNATPKNISQPGNYTVSDGIFTDPSGPYFNYVDFNDGITTINPATAGSKVSLSFAYFNTYNENDYLEIHDGTSITDPVLATLHGTQGYGTITATNPTGSLTCRFVSDGGANWNGWAAVISNNATPKIISLPGTYTLNSGFMYDGSGPDVNYYDNVNTVTTVVPAVPTYKMSVAFSYLYTYNVNDHIEVFDGNSTAAPLVGDYSGNNSVFPPIITSTAADGSLTFRWTADAGANFTGFAAALSVDPCTLLKVEDVAAIQGAQLYPNPAKNSLFVELADFNNQPVELSIYNLTGQKLFSKTITQQKSELTLNYPNGIYMVTISNAKQSITKKLIIQQ